MTVLLDATFATDTEGFSAGTHNSGEGADFAPGYLQVAAATAERTFTAVSAGDVRTDVWVRLTDSETIAGGTKNSFIYLLPTAGTVISSNSITTIGITRDSATVTGAETQLSYRNATSFANWTFAATGAEGIMPRGQWLKISVVQHWTGLTFDLYLNDILWFQGIGFANAAAADFSRVVLNGSAAAPNTDFDSVRVESEWTRAESVLLDHTFVGGSGEIETLVPTTDGIALHAQPWKVPNDLTTFGAFTVGANGAAPDSGKKCAAMVRCGHDGIFELEFHTSVAGVRYMGLWYRVWAGIDSALSTDRAYNVVRFYSSAGAGTQWSHFVGGAKTDAAVQTSGSNLLVANTTYTLKIEVRGRYVTSSIKTAAIDAGSYGALLAAWLINSNAAGARGQLAEEHAGPFVDLTLGATDNYVRRFRYTGALPPSIVAI